MVHPTSTFHYIHRIELQNILFGDYSSVIFAAAARCSWRSQQPTRHLISTRRIVEEKSPDGRTHALSHLRMAMIHLRYIKWGTEETFVNISLFRNLISCRILLCLENGTGCPCPMRIAMRCDAMLYSYCSCAKPVLSKLASRPVATLHPSTQHCTVEALIYQLKIKLFVIRYGNTRRQLLLLSYEFFKSSFQLLRRIVQMHDKVNLGIKFVCYT